MLRSSIPLSPLKALRFPKESRCKLRCTYKNLPFPFTQPSNTPYKNSTNTATHPAIRLPAQQVTNFKHLIHHPFYSNSSLDGLNSNISSSAYPLFTTPQNSPGNALSTYTIISPLFHSLDVHSTHLLNLFPKPSLILYTTRTKPFQIRNPFCLFTFFPLLQRLHFLRFLE
jgi:hypothetical protein